MYILQNSNWIVREVGIPLFRLDRAEEYSGGLWPLKHKLDMKGKNYGSQSSCYGTGLRLTAAAQVAEELRVRSGASTVG